MPKELYVDFYMPPKASQYGRGDDLGLSDFDVFLFVI